MALWNFFTNYGHVIFVLATEPDLTTREIASRVGITERATQRIISELESEGFVRITKLGRKNRYHVSRRKHLRHPIEKSCKISDLIELVDTKS